MSDNDSFIRIVQDAMRRDTQAMKRALSGGYFIPPIFDDPVKSPATTALGQAAAQIAPRLAEIFGGTAKEWEDSIVKRCTDEEPRRVHGFMATSALLDRVDEVTRTNLNGIVTGWTG